MKIIIKIASFDCVLLPGSSADVLNPLKITMPTPGSCTEVSKVQSTKPLTEIK
jgi:hypothetical protein